MCPAHRGQIPRRPAHCAGVAEEVAVMPGRVRKAANALTILVRQGAWVGDYARVPRTGLRPPLLLYLATPPTQTPRQRALLARAPQYINAGAVRFGAQCSVDLGFCQIKDEAAGRRGHGLPRCARNDDTFAVIARNVVTWQSTKSGSRPGAVTLSRAPSWCAPGYSLTAPAHKAPPV